MPAGSISLTNGSGTVTGEGTSFTNEVKIGDYIAFTSDGISYAYPVSAISSDTSLTIKPVFAGPTKSELPFNVIPSSQMQAIPTRLITQVTNALLQDQADRANWQKLLTEDGNVTITNPDGTQTTGPSWPAVSKGIDATNLDKAQQIADQTSAAATAAATSETNAKASEDAAAQSSSDASTSATNAAESAQQAADSASSIGDELDQASASAAAAAKSATDAAASEANASTSETNAKASEDAAAASQQTAAESQSAAAASETNAASSEANAADSANAAATSEQNASQSASDSADSATASATSETNAASSASDSADNATSASASADRAEAAADALENNNALANAIDHIDTDTHDVFFKASIASGATSAFTELRTISDGTTPATSEIVLTDNTGVTDEEPDATVIKTWSMPDEEGQLIRLADTGIESVSESNVTFDGAVSVGVEAVKDNDLVTLRQLRSATAGSVSGGPTLNGVMNNALGAVEWFNGSRAAIWPGYLPADGQILNRADYPDLWNAVESGFFISVSDDDWLAGIDSGGHNNQASYSTGDGSTTFRLPDLNGTQSTSVPNLYLRGVGVVNPNVGKAHQDGAPNIVGSWSAGGAVGVINKTNSQVRGAIGKGTTDKAYGAPYVNNNISSPAVGASPIVQNTPLTGNDLTFDASKSYAGYGRSPTEIRPSSALGIWMIRVNGIFKADTSFQVITADEALPASGSVVNGGVIDSIYNAGGNNLAAAQLRVNLTVGQTPVAMLDIIDKTTDEILTDTVIFSRSGMTYREGSGTGSDNNRNGGNYRSETAQSFGQMRAYRNSADGGLVFEVSQDGGASRNFFMTGNGAMVVPGGMTALNGEILSSNADIAAAVTATGTPNNGDFLNSPAVRSMLFGRGVGGDARGAFFGMYHQEYVGNYSQGIFNLNGYGTDHNWFFRQDGNAYSPGGQFVTGGSDVRLKDNIQPVKVGSGERIDAIKVIEFEWWKTGEKDRGYIAQEMDEIDPCYTNLGGENTDKDGNKFEVMGVKDRAILADMIVCVQNLRKEKATLKDELNKSQATIKSLIEALGYLADDDQNAFKDNLNSLRAGNI
ncbi:hypothetical protein C1Y41_04680 [Pantoea sp. ICBG 1758]|uniref:tail fiber domain-containing protein n=1 Tax=Pantoea sp. ICBG 1758 TaxID=2071682 RepID=UPI000CE2EC4A|nr:tail fiber domain-containing protein [Pantoea sp. ICBG 1758]PPC63942.1 hypothetical protein C1Y41_04680 [Pantoea sp. ICBG 1758]